MTIAPVPETAARKKPARTRVVARLHLHAPEPLLGVMNPAKPQRLIVAPVTVATPQGAYRVAQPLTVTPRRPHVLSPLH